MAAHNKCYRRGMVAARVWATDREALIIGTMQWLQIRRLAR